MSEKTREGIADRKPTSFRAQIVTLPVGAVTKQMAEVNLYKSRFFMVYTMDSGGNVDVFMFLGTGNPGIVPTAGMKFKGSFDKVRFTSGSPSVVHILIIFTEDPDFDIDLLIPYTTFFATPVDIGSY